MKKKLFWLIESNGDLSVTCPSIQRAMDLLDSDFNDLDKEDRMKTEYTITPVWYTNREYKKPPEA